MTIYEIAIDEFVTHKQSDSSKLYFKQKENLELLRSVNNKLKLYLKEIDKFSYKISKKEKTMIERIKGKMKEIESYEED